MTNIFARYIIIGLLNTVVGYLLYAVFIFIGLHYSMAVFLSTVLGVLFNFKTIGALVFKNNSNRLIYRFVTVYMLTYLLNVGGLHVLNDFNLNMYLAGAIMLAPMAIISFLLHKTFVFRPKGWA